MNRQNFIKLITVGAGFLLASPTSLIPNAISEKYNCGLFFRGKEIACNGYKRVKINPKEELFSLKNNSITLINIPDSVFSLLENYEIRIDEVRIYRKKDNEPIAIYGIYPRFWTVYNGIFTVKWNQI